MTAAIAPPSTDLLAIALDRARRFAEARPDDARAQRELLEAEVAFLRAEIARRDRRIVGLQRRLLEIARRLKRANALLASARRAGKRGKRRAEAIGQMVLAGVES